MAKSLRKPQFIPKDPKTAKESNEIIKSMLELIDFDRIKILNVVKDIFNVEINGKDILFPGSEAGVRRFHDAPKEFKEAVMFYEFQKKEYDWMNLKDSHERARLDEFFTP